MERCWFESSQGCQMTVEKFPLSDRDKFMVKMWNGGSGLPADIAATVHKYGLISKKQREVLEKATRKNVRQNWWSYYNKEGYKDFGPRTGPSYTVREDYDESDYEIGAYELCVGEWGD